MAFDPATRIQTQEVRQVVDNLLEAFLAASPKNADLPIVRHARDLVGRLPRASELGVWSAFQPESRTADDAATSFIKGCD